MAKQIDQSGKTEATNSATVITYANGKAKSLKISAKEKRKILAVMRDLGFHKKFFTLRTFAGLVFLLTKDEDIDEIVIDIEYSGHERTIKDIILHLYEKYQKSPPRIRFKQIGKQNKAHRTAIDVFRSRKKPDKLVKAKELLELFF